MTAFSLFSEKLNNQYFKTITMSLTKQDIKEKSSLCKVTFKVDKEIAPTANEVYLVGDFNNWNVQKGITMKKTKAGEFTASVNLEKGKEYQFKYLVDGKAWINEKQADKFIPNEFQTENSVIVV